jgi:hypothetical protein
MTGTFVSATQSALAHCPGPDLETKESAENCFDDSGAFDLSEAAAQSGALLSAPARGLRAAAADTLETYEIELEDEGKKGINYKAIIGFTIAAAFIGYAIYVLLVPEEEETEEPPPGKEPPISLITIPFGG